MTIDLNTILTNALNAAIEQATAPLRERIEALEAQQANACTAALPPGLEAANARIDAVERMVRALEEQTTPAAADARIRDIAEAVLSEHIDKYDHDEFLTDESDLSQQVSKVLETYDFDDIADEIVEPAVRRALRSATVSIDL